MDNLIKILAIIVTFGIIILIHECGHFFSARIFGARVEEFGLGLPPRICGIRKIKGKYKFFWRNRIPKKKNIDATIYSLNFIPVGGFVKITGEDGEGKLTKEKDLGNFNSKKPWQRSVILLAGVTMNLILGLFLFMVVFWMGSMPLVEPEKADYDYDIVESRVTVVGVSEDSPAEEAGLKAGDVIQKVNEVDMDSDDDLVRTINQNADNEIAIGIKRGQQEKSITATPVVIEGYYMIAKDIDVSSTEVSTDNQFLQKDDIVLWAFSEEEEISFDDKNDLLTYFEENQDTEVELRVQRGNEVLTVKSRGNIITSENDLNAVGILGLSATNIDKVHYTWWKVPYYAVKETGRFLIFMPQELVRVFSDYFTGEVDEVPVSGPVGIAVITGRAVSFGLVMVISLMINITIALAVFNALPFPALDGGRVVFIIIEKLRGKPISPKIEQKVNAIGLLILLGMAALITVNDVFRFSDVLKFWE